MSPRKKLIEVALPLEAINIASAREKSIRHGHPSTLHLWWARRPLAAARAVIFASLVDDPNDPNALPAFVEACRNLPKPPSFGPDEVPTPRDRLLFFIERLVQWESTTDEAILSTARELIRIATEGNLPPLLDPFAGGGSIPLEAQRLGLEAHASDLNPVAVMINKAQIEIPPRFANLPPVNPRDRAKMFGGAGGATQRGATQRGATQRGATQRVAPTDGYANDKTWRGAAGLAADVRYYGEWMRDRAWERIGHLYPLYSTGDPAGRPNDAADRPHDPAGRPHDPAGRPHDPADRPNDAAGRPHSPADHPHNGETVIAWIWARTVKSPNPAVNAHVPLVRSFILSKKKGRERWAKPIVEPIGTGDPPGRPHNPAGRPNTHTVRFEVVEGLPPKEYDSGTMSGRTGGRCIISGEPIPKDYIKSEAQAGRMGAMLMAIVTEGANGRSYYSPTSNQASTAVEANPDWRPVGELAYDPRNIWVKDYGLTQFADLFTPRQLVALTTFSDLVAEARAQALRDAVAAGLPDDGVPLREGGRGALAYAEAVSVYLAFAVDRQVERTSTIASWQSSADFVRGTFARQALPMVWDYAEVNPFSSSTGNFLDNAEWVAEATESILWTSGIISSYDNANQRDAAGFQHNDTRVLSTDPPYYDNIGYADLSDYFYIWMRRMLREVYPDIFGTLLVPKEPELIASPYRHGGKDAANAHFERGMVQTFTNIRRFVSSDYPLTVYYAFKQQDADAADEDEIPDDDVRATRRVAPTQTSTGWETFLAGLIQSGFSIDGTWPMRTERAVRSVGLGTNALASSIVLVCRPRPVDAPSINRRQFVDALRRELPTALKEMQSGNIAPVDLAQASIGPGMAIYSRYSKVLESDGSAMTVRAALGLINQELDAYLAEQDGNIDGETRFAIAWFEQYDFREGEFGVADVLARAKNTSVAGIEAAGLVVSGRGKVRLIHWKDYDPGAWSPDSDRRPTVWEATHHLIERLNSHGETGSGALIARMSPEMAAEARNLAYRLYSICERKGWAEHARDYNALVISWSGIGEEAARIKQERDAGDATRQMGMFGDL